ncbi:MAG: hypothetical protein Q8R28_18140 [Dehalococcoidia bacterium]|nr:hypothetical protein [Dehalococcoidia bacterium]
MQRDDARDRSGDALPSPPDAPPDISSLPRWQRRYIEALAAGLSDHDARQRAAHPAPDGGLGNAVSHYSIQRAALESAATPDQTFARAYALVTTGAALPTSLATLRQQAMEYAPVLLEDSFGESRDPETRPRDRLANRRLLLEAAGAVGAGTAPQGGANVMQIVIRTGDVVETVTIESDPLKGKGDVETT